jgi:hypothetical protein
MTLHVFNRKEVNICIYRQTFLAYKLWLLLIPAFFFLIAEDMRGQNEPKDTMSVIDDITHFYQIALTD